MPKDLNGKELAVGDLVNVPCKIIDIREEEDSARWNIIVETVNHIPNTAVGTQVPLNSKLVIKE